MIWPACLPTPFMVTRRWKISAASDGASAGTLLRTAPTTHLRRGCRAPGGGCVAAVIGVDGSGKSTVVAAIRAWLGQEIDVVPIYFGTGSGRPSLLLWPFKLMVPLITLLLRTKPQGASHGKI